MNYKNPRLTVDGLIIRDDSILLIKRGRDPFKGSWALPGGFVEYGETTEDAVIREILEETGLRCTINKLFGVYSTPDRDPRGHTISIVYHLDQSSGALMGGDDAVDACYHLLSNMPHLAFDHEKIIRDFMERESV